MKKNKMFGILRMVLVPCSVLFIINFFSCSRTEPTIAYGFLELVYYQEKSGPRECFSFFIIPEDEDGIENLADLYLYHDHEQLCWHISGEDWVSYTSEDKTWIGTRSISASGDEPLPRGQFRAVLVNKGGEKSERIFSFDAPAEMRFPFPTLDINQGQYTITSSYPANRLVCYDDQGNHIFTANLTASAGSIESLGLPSQARTAALWAADSQYLTSAYTDVTAIRR